MIEHTSNEELANRPIYSIAIIFVVIYFCLFVFYLLIWGFIDDFFLSPSLPFSSHALRLSFVDILKMFFSPSIFHSDNQGTIRNKFMVIFTCKKYPTPPLIDSLVIVFLFLKKKLEKMAVFLNSEQIFLIIFFNPYQASICLANEFSLVRRQKKRLWRRYVWLEKGQKLFKCN